MFLSRPRLPTSLAALLLIMLPLGACSLFDDDEERLEGPRIPVRAAVPDDAGPEPITRPLPPQRELADWTQVGSGASHNGGNIAGPSGPLSRVWSADAGTGNSADSTITSPPVVAGGTVFTLDAAAEVRAFDVSSGALRWASELTPDETEEGDEGFGGGLAAVDDRLFVTTGFGEVLALSQASGEVLWRQRFSGPFRAGPAVAGGRLVAVTRNSTALALDLSDGSVLWRNQGVGANAGLLGGAAPVIAGGATVIPFASGELSALDLISGRTAWTAVLTGGRRGLARAAITDLTGDPVVIGPIVVAANQSGRLAAFEGATGRRIWTRAVGATRPLWAAGDTLFLVSDTGVLMRLDAASGQTLWERALPVFEDPEDREDPITYSGPVLVADRLLLTDSLGNLLSHDAVTGDGQVVADVPGGSHTGPIAAGGRVFVLSDDGVLYAFR